MLRRYSVHGMETLPLNKTVITIGSAAGCDITLSDPNLAEKHAEIEYHPLPQAYFLKDLDTLSGTTLNGEPVYGMVELKPNNAIRFGYGPEYVFELPKATCCKPTIKKISQGHVNCTASKDTPISLPVVGVKERKILPAIATKQNSHPPPRPRRVRLITEIEKPTEEREKKNFLTTEKLSPISRVRSASIDPSITRGINKPSRPENGRFVTKTYGTPSPTSSANSSVDLPSNRRNTVLGTINYDYAQSTNNNLLQRVVRLQMELHRRDLEINQLRERILSNSVPADPARVSFSYPDPVGHTEGAKLLEPRSPTDVAISVPPTALHRCRSPNLHEPPHTRTLEMDVEIRNEFLKLLAVSLQSFNDRLLTFPMRDYADIFSEMTRCLAEPISYTVGETEKQCVDNISKRYMLISERQVAHQLLEKYIQDSIQPLVKQIEQILPVVRDAALIARESVKVCTVFTAWSREFGDEIRTNGLTSNMLLNKADALMSRFKENSLSKHWLPPSLTPLLRVASLEFRKRIESRTVSTKDMASVQSQTEAVNEAISADRTVEGETNETQQESDGKESVHNEPNRNDSSPTTPPTERNKSDTVDDEKTDKQEGVEHSESHQEVEEIHNLSTAPPSELSSQKTSMETDSEQANHLRQIARNLAAHVLENIEVSDTESSKDTEHKEKLVCGELRDEEEDRPDQMEENHESNSTTVSELLKNDTLKQFEQLEAEIEHSAPSRMDSVPTPPSTPLQVPADPEIGEHSKRESERHSLLENAVSAAIKERNDHVSTSTTSPAVKEQAEHGPANTAVKEQAEHASGSTTSCAVNVKKQSEHLSTTTAPPTAVNEQAEHDAENTTSSAVHVKDQSDHLSTATVSKAVKEQAEHASSNTSVSAMRERCEHVPSSTESSSVKERVEHASASTTSSAVNVKEHSEDLPTTTVSPTVKEQTEHGSATSSTMKEHSGHMSTITVTSAANEHISDEDSISSASPSLPTVIAKDVDETEHEHDDISDDVPFAESLETKNLGEECSELLKTEQRSSNLDYISDIRSDAPSRLSHRLEHHIELDDPEDEMHHHNRKESSEFWRLVTNLGRALALECEIDKTRKEKTDESEKRSLAMESLMNQSLMNAQQPQSFPPGYAVPAEGTAVVVQSRKRRTAGEFFRKYFLDGQILDDDAQERKENIPEDATFDEILLIKYRKFIAFLIPFLCAQTVWWLTAWKFDYFSLFPTHWHMPVTMIVGATVAGMTSEGGGAVAFPVMTFILHIDPTTARDFSLMIQSVAMTLALFVIVFMRIQIEWRAIVLATVGAVPGVVVGFSWLDPMFTGPQKKMVFVSCWCAFALSLWILNRQKKRLTYTRIPDLTLWKALVLVATGAVGGVLNSMAGSGVDICTFSVITLLFRISEKTATPTTVVLMGINSIIAVYWRAVMMGNIAQLAWDYLKVTVPVSVTFAPFGSFLGSHFHRLVLAMFIYILEAAALVGFLFTNPPASLLLAGSLIIVGGFIFFSLLSNFGERLMQSIEEEKKEAISQQPQL